MHRDGFKAIFPRSSWFLFHSSPRHKSPSCSHPSERKFCSAPIMLLVHALQLTSQQFPRMEVTKREDFPKCSRLYLPLYSAWIGIPGHRASDLAACMTRKAAVYTYVSLKKNKPRTGRMVWWVREPQPSLTTWIWPLGPTEWKGRIKVVLQLPQVYMCTHACVSTHL